MLKKEAPKRIVRANLNPEIKRKLAGQEIISKGINQSSGKKNSFQQVKQRSTLPKANQSKNTKKNEPSFKTKVR